MADLESSLTAMDWLPRLTVGGAMAGHIGKDGVKTQGGNLAMRKAPHSPLDTNATLDENDGKSHREGKPPYSYANLITFAINSSSKKKMTLSEIYQWICDNFPYYKDAGNGWKVGVWDERTCMVSCTIVTYPTFGIVFFFCVFFFPLKYLL